MATTVASEPEAASSVLLPELAPAGSAVFVDTNVLIYASFPELPLAQVARTRLNELKDADLSFWASRQVLREFLATATRPGTLKASSPVKEIVGSVRTWEKQLTIADEDAQVTQHLLAFLENPGARGKQVHDANIAATMRRYAIPYLLTHNTADFARYAPWVTVLPLIP